MSAEYEEPSTSGHMPAMLSMPSQSSFGTTNTVNFDHTRSNTGTTAESHSDECPTTATNDAAEIIGPKVRIHRHGIEAPQSSTV